MDGIKTTKGNGKQIKIIDLFNNYLYDVSVEIDRAQSLLGILLDSYLSNDTENIYNNEQAKLTWEYSYNSVQTLASAAFDYIYKVKKAIDDINNIDLKCITL